MLMVQMTSLTLTHSLVDVHGIHPQLQPLDGQVDGHPHPQLC